MEEEKVNINKPTEQVKVYVWNPLHKNHQFEKAGIYPTYLGIMYMWKCRICGDVNVRFEKSGYQKVRIFER